MSTCACAPRGGLPQCSQCVCPQWPAPVIVNPAQAVLAAAADACGVNDGLLRHDQVVTLNTATYYEFNGSYFLHLAVQDRIGFTAHPRFPLSTPFQWRLRKYPAMGIDVAPDGTVPYQSAGYVIREGDNLMLDCLGNQRTVSHFGAANPYNLPVCAVPQSWAISDFAQFGTKSPENVRIVSDDFDPTLPPAEQPPVRTNGTKAYYLQFTRDGQYLSVLPGQTPAPGLVKTSGAQNLGSRLLILPVGVHQQYMASAAPAPATAALVPTTNVIDGALRPQDRSALPGVELADELETVSRNARNAVVTANARIAEAQRAAATNAPNAAQARLNADQAVTTANEAMRQLQGLNNAVNGSNVVNVSPNNVIFQS